MVETIVEPSNIRRAANPGETVTQEFVVNVVPQGTLVATISGGGSYIRLKEFVAYQFQQRWYTEDEILDLPPPLRKNARQEGYKELVEVSRVEAGMPLIVSNNFHVKGVIEFVAPITSVSTSESATLIIEGWGGNRIEIPITFVIGDIQVEFLINPIVAHIGQEILLPVQVNLPTGCPTTEITINSFKPWVAIPPITLNVPSGGSATTTLKLRVDNGAPLGVMLTELWINGYSGRTIFVPFEIVIKEFSQLILATEQIQAKVSVQSEGPPGIRTPLSGVEEAGEGGFVQRFSTGNIYWHKETGAKWVYGAILQKYLFLGGPRSFLGYPVTDELPTSNWSGRFNDFKNGSIYFSNQSGAQEIHGKIREHWRAIGAETSYLGYPTFDQKLEFSRFENGTIQIRNNDFVFDVSDAREFKTGIIHVDGAAANGWAELMLSSSGGFKFKGSMRSTGVFSYDVIMIITIDLSPFGGPVIAFTENGDVEGTFVWGGHRAHTWDGFGMDDRIKDNWQLIKRAGISAIFKVDFGPGDVLAIVGSVIAVVGTVGLILLAGATGTKNRKPCGYIGHDYFDRDTNEWRTEKGVVFVPKDQLCPPGTFE
ncbi:LGFP repeat-containing protein [Bacillus toyonensis]|uniref:LGFP repeat-containing protein n=1 Tax=Bacillus toyonensis TaxID=155322 RepID=UPI001C3F4BD4|nr:hypothetical protein [Bacillus toyonensis]